MGKCVHVSEMKLEIEEKEIAEHQQDLLVFNVLDVTRHSWVDGSEHEGIWTDI